MTVADYVIIGFIVVFALLGLKNGLLKSIYKVAAYILSVYLAIKLSKPVANLFKRTGLFEGIRNSVEKVLSGLNVDFTGITDPSNADSIFDAIKDTPFPDNIKTMIADAMSKTSESAVYMMDDFIEKIAFFVLVILCAVVLFILLRILFWLASFLVRGIASVPIIKQVDRFAGFILGAAVGVGVVLMIALLLVYTASFEKLAPVYENINNGVIAPYFYNNNILADLFVFIKEGWV